MCGRYAVSKRPQVYMRKLYPEWDGAVKEERPPTWNLAPTALAWVIREIEAAPSISLLKWGFGYNEAEKGLAPINARAETVADKFLFRSAWRSQRCLVPADGWYEWKKEDIAKQPYYFTPFDGEPIYFAGIWTGNTFAILTTEADGKLTAVHHRKPVSLENEYAKHWLREPIPHENLVSACEKPDAFNVYPVNKIVSNWRNDGENLVVPLK